MAKDIAAERRLRVRANRGRRLWPQLKQSLEGILDEELTADSLLPLDQTDELKRVFFERLRANRDLTRVVREPSRVGELWSRMDQLAKSTGDTEVFLFHRFDEYTGALRVKAGRALSEGRRIWAAVGRNDICLSTLEASDGLCFEFTHGGVRDEYELRFWGIFDAPLEAETHDRHSDEGIDRGKESQGS